MSSPRQLAYKDRFVWYLQQVVSSIFDDCDDFDDRYVFPDMDTRVPLVIFLSQRQWTTLYSAVLTGADLSYPNTSHDVEYLFLQTVICPMNELCQAIADCILNSEATQAALIQFLADNGLSGGVGDPSAPISDGSLEENLLPDGYVCTDDKAFGMALAVVDAINEATTEVLQAIEIVTNPIEIAAELGDNIPGIGMIASAGDTAAWIQDSAKEGYDLAWSTVVRDELACLLWCEFKWDCELSLDTIWDIYLGASEASPPTGVTLEEWLAWLVLLPFTAALSTVATISLLGLLAMRYGSSFGDFALGIRSLEMVMQLAADDSSSDWSIVCDPCSPTWCYEWSVGLGNLSDWTAYNSGDGPRATLSGSGWGIGPIPSHDHLVQIYIPTFAPARLITHVEMAVTVVPTQNYAVRMPDVSGSEYAAGCVGGTPSPCIVLPDTNGTGFWLGVSNAGFVLYTGHITSIHIEGEGVNPFGADNC